MVNKGSGVYTLVRLGKRIVTRNGGEMWDGSAIVKVGSRRECEEAADEQSNPND
jgi:hypothetical protein